jgi:hypothetical protein
MPPAPAEDVAIGSKDDKVSETDFRSSGELERLTAMSAYQLNKQD